MKPWFFIPAEWAHNWAPLFLQLYGFLPGKKNLQARSFNWRGLHFKNPLGIAGGVDKDAENLPAWWRMGMGFVEVGTVTPIPQNPNPGKIMDRDIQLQAVWNKMGFPSSGMSEVRANLELYFAERQTPIFVNIGKNRTTDLSEAHNDYIKLIRTLNSVADVFVVNISSPNTQGLRSLQSKEYLTAFLQPILAENKLYGKPLLLKLSPDNSREDLQTVLETSVELGVDGFILTNTTTSRTPDMHFAKEGGVSGRPLQVLAKQTLAWAIEILGEKRKNLLIVSAGGVLNAQDAKERLQIGADLVQIYSGLIFHGPGIFEEICKDL